MDKLDILQKQKQLNLLKVGVDPVRPHLDIMFRTSKGREIFGLMNSDISRADGSFVDVHLLRYVVLHIVMKYKRTRTR